MWHFWTPTDVNRSLAYDVCGLGHRVHGDTRTGAKPLLFANLDQEEVVPTHHSLHLLPLLLPAVHVVWIRDRLRLPLRPVQED